MTNLLPEDRKSAISHDYAMRIGVVATLVVAVLAVSASVLLVPSYIYLVKSEDAKKGQLENVNSTMSTAEEKELFARLSALSNDSASLIALGDARAASAVLRDILDVERIGVTITSVSYTPAAGKAKPATVIVSGIAETRNALRDYQLALQKSPIAVSAELPVSAYAKDSQIPYMITVTLEP